MEGKFKDINDLYR
jgi:hypothetical protein